MDSDLNFLNFDGLDASQVRHLSDLLHPSNLIADVEFPWSECCDDRVNKKENTSSLNVHAPVFETYIPSKADHVSAESNYSYSNGTHLPDVVPVVSDTHSFVSYANDERTAQNLPNFTNGLETHEVFDSYVSYSHMDGSAQPINGGIYQQPLNDHVPSPISSFKLNPTVSSFVPQNIRNYVQCEELAGTVHQNGVCKEEIHHESPSSDNFSHVPQNGDEQSYAPSDKSELLPENSTDNTSSVENVSPVLNLNTPDSDTAIPNKTAITPPASVVAPSPSNTATVTKPVQRSWAQIVSSGQTPAEKVPLKKPQTVKGNKLKEAENKEAENLSLEEDKMSLVLGKHLYEVQLDFKPVYLQPRGLINRRNWCYIHATLQALLASSPFYTLLRNLPLGPGVERGKSSTPVIDSMVKITYEFSQLESSQEELNLGQAFQPDFIYDMLKDLKSDCLKGQQEDAEEFLSFILNNMHEEMVKIIKNYEKKNCITSDIDVKENGDLSDGEEGWQVIGSKHKGMVTRKVVEHKTPISDLLGGQIKSFLTTSGNKTSASIQPFFTLQLDIQSEHVNSVSEALKEMTLKEPIQGYTCAKTKQVVEAYSHIALQKLPPVLILHLKRFVYNKNGGCKKVLKKTDYPLELELSRDLFSSDIKKAQRIKMYKLFAVMYHDGEEAVKGHYISDVYNYGSQTWIRCDDRQITAVTEAQVLSHSPPRVPYLLFYQES